MRVLVALLVVCMALLLCSQLCDAKRGCLQEQGVSNPTMDAIEKSINKAEMARHCRRRTRGVGETVKAIEALLLQFTPATDTLGVPVFRYIYSTTDFSKQIVDIWEVESKHVACIQDPEGLPLYTVTGHITKGGLRLPVFRCSRGTTSLESFHLHLARYVHGSIVQ